MGFSVGVKLGNGVGVLNLGVGVAKAGSGVSVGVGNDVGVFVGTTKYAVGTDVSSRFAAAVAVRLAGVMYPLLQTMVSAAVIHRRKISLMRLCVGMFFIFGWCSQGHDIHTALLSGLLGGDSHCKGCRSLLKPIHPSQRGSIGQRESIHHYTVWLCVR